MKKMFAVEFMKATLKVIFLLAFQGKTVGVFVKDNFQGQFVDEWKNAFEKESFEKVSIQNN